MTEPTDEENATESPPSAMTPANAKEKDPIISFRIPHKDYTEVERIRKVLRRNDEKKASRSEIGRSILLAALDENHIDKIIEISKDRRETYATTLKRLMALALSVDVMPK